jgi:hypothetical protein
MPKRNVAHVHRAVLIAIGTGEFAVDPTIEAGDFQVKIDDGAFAPLATTPVADGRSVRIALSAAEMDGEAIHVIASDQVGAEWTDYELFLETTETTPAEDMAAIIAAILSRAEPGDEMTLTSGERDSIAAALLDLADAIESGLTPREALRLILASAAGQTAGAGSGTFRLKSLDGTKTRATYPTDIAGNRTGYTEGDLT